MRIKSERIRRVTKRNTFTVRTFSVAVLSLLFFSLVLLAAQDEASRQSGIREKIRANPALRGILSSAGSRLWLLRQRPVEEGPPAAVQNEELPATLVNNPDFDSRWFSQQNTPDGVITKNGTIIIAYADLALTAPVGISRSFDGGQSFHDESFKIYDQGADLKIALAGGVRMLYDPAKNRVYLLSLAQFFDPLKVGLVLLSSEDDGETWQWTDVLPSSPEIWPDKPWGWLDRGGNLHLTFTSVTVTSAGELSLNILYTVSPDGGAHFTQPIHLSAAGQLAQWSQVVTVGKRVMVFWEEFPPTEQFGDPMSPRWIVNATSRDGGTTFGSPVKLFPIWPTGHFISYFDPNYGRNGLEIRKWLLHGGWRGTAEGGFRIFDNLSAVSDENPDSPVYGTVYLTWSQGERRADGVTSQEARVYLSCLTSDGKWLPPRSVEPTAGDQFFPTLAVGTRGEVALLFFDRRDDPDNLWIRPHVMEFHFDTKKEAMAEMSSAMLTVPFVPSVWIPNPEFKFDFGDYLSIFPDPEGGFHTAFVGTFRQVQDTIGEWRPDQDVYHVPVP